MASHLKYALIGVLCILIVDVSAKISIPGQFLTAAFIQASTVDEEKDLAAGSQLNIVAGPKSVELLEGKNSELSCEAFGTPVPTIQWLHNGKAIRQQQKKFATLSSPVLAEKIHNHGVRTFQMSTTSSKMRIPCANRDTVGHYTCVASNGRETVTANATVDLVQKDNSVLFGNDCPRKRADGGSEAEPAQIYMWTDSRLERPGVSVQLMCRAAGRPTPQIEWYESDDSEGGANDLKQIQADDPRFSLLPNGDLLVKESPTDTPVSMFQCRAFNENGQDSVNSMLLEVIDDTEENGSDHGQNKMV